MSALLRLVDTNCYPPNMQLLAIIQLAALASFSYAFPAGSLSVTIPPNIQTRDCSAQISSFNAKRRVKRNLKRRTFYSNLQNTTCIASPATPKGSNWLSGTVVRYDVTNGQQGVPLTLDVGVIDVTTCKPISGALVEIWSPNAVGNYGKTFLRGAQSTDTAGIAELQTIFPGFTSGSANHIGAIVHPNWSGGNVAPSSGAAHVGRIFFTDAWTNVISQSAPYNTNPNSRMMNAQDPMFKQANSAGYSAIVDLEEIQDDWPEGIVGYITIGVIPHTSM
ncbi:aromatic compound dioxygenase [Rickenella mellea]|uniref:Aromatic compound dioxygenase n=1 Tax=Rickenella mellea TaxID=50990 RepID=A0A4Y7PNV3_9AGAM|nr:aromatic compound dioxygenase [Rickenella mellea]